MKVALMKQNQSNLENFIKAKEIKAKIAIQMNKLTPLGSDN